MTNLSQKSELDSYAEWINQTDWSFFCTFTTHYELTLPSARRLMERTHQKYLNYFGECQLFWVAEPFECKEGFHTHGLLKVPETALNKSKVLPKFHFQNVVDMYQSMVGGKVLKNDNGKLTFDKWNRIELKKFDQRKNAGRYACKYIKKSQYGKGDYDILI
jgi:hypothetical protein